MFWDHTPTELFLKGGFAMWPLLACSIAGLALIFDRTIVFMFYRGTFRNFVRRLEPLIVAGRIDDARAEIDRWRFPIAAVARAFLDQLDRNRETRTEICEREGSERIAILDERLGWLSSIAQIAPLLGLLGTVTGLVSAFHALEVQGGAAQPSDLAAGIWEALITTVFGLCIAIPCMAAYHYFDNRLARTSLQMEWMISYLEQWLHLDAKADAAPSDRTKAAIGK